MSTKIPLLRENKKVGRMKPGKRKKALQKKYLFLNWTMIIVQVRRCMNIQCPLIQINNSHA